MRRIVLYIIILTLFVSCKTQSLLKDSKETQKKPIFDSAFVYNPKYEYHIRKNDKISISIWGQDNLSIGSIFGVYNSNEVYGKWAMVDINGNIEIPQIGIIKVENKTVLQLKDTLRQIHSQRVLNPIIDVKILNKEITIIGEVKNTGIFNVDKDNNTLIELLARSGGFDFYANIKYIKILRQEGENVRLANIDLSKSKDILAQNIQLHPGDIVIVPSKKYKEFDKRISTTILPFTSTVSAAALLYGTFFKK